MGSCEHQAQIKVPIVRTKVECIDKLGVGVTNFYHVLLIVGYLPITIGIKILINTRNCSVLCRPGIDLFLGIEDAHHFKACQHPNWPSYPRHVVGTVHASVPNSICITLYGQHLISVKGDIKIASEMNLIQTCFVVECQLNTMDLDFTHVRNRKRKT